MYREGYALVLSNGISSLLGFPYWALAARAYTPGVLGLNSAMISAMMFVAGVSQLSLATATVRFLPGAGLSARRFVITVYLITVVAATVVTMVFLAGTSLWTPTLTFIRDTPGAALAFTISAMAWGAFNLQHSVLTGLRRAVWVPLENGVYSIGKLGLVVMFARLLPQWGIFTSWTIGLGLTVLPTMALIFAWLIPRHMRLPQRDAAQPTISNVAKYIAGDYVGGLCWLASTTLVPLIVFEEAGPAANAYFSLAWVFVMPLYVIGASMGSSLVVSAVLNSARLRALSYRMLLQTSLLVVPAAAVLIIGAPYILRVFGDQYATQGANVLRLLALATIPGTLNTLYVNVARVQRKMVRVALIYAGQCAVLLGLTWVVVKPLGLDGVGLAWLISQSVVAVIILSRVLVAHRSEFGLHFGEAR
jgi:O-antigen/teichoic acid export membrane protein